MDDDSVSLLERVRSALSGMPRGPRRVPAAQRCVRVRAELVDLFVDRLEGRRTGVHRVTRDAVDPTLALLRGAGTATVATASLGIATTGVLVLTEVPEDARGADADVHICVLHESRVVLGEPEALALLGLRRHQTWIGSPATAELDDPAVEPSRDGPRLEVVVVGDPV